MNKRIKELRKTYLKLTQQKMADELGVKRNTIAMYEMGKIVPSNTMVSLICQKYGVNETWLRTGEGEVMVAGTRAEAIAKEVANMLGENNPFKEKIILALLRIPSDKWALIEQAAREVLAEDEENRDD